MRAATLVWVLASTAKLATGTIPQLVEKVRSGTDRAKEEAAGALRNLVINNNDNRVAIAAAGGIAPLVELARSGTAGAKEQAAGALFNPFPSPGNAT